MTLRSEAGDKWKRPHFASERELMASPLEMCCMTISRSTSRARPSSSSSWTSSFCTMCAKKVALAEPECQTSVTGFEMKGFRTASLFLVLLMACEALAAATTVDRIAALVDRQVLTVTEVSQMVELRFFPRKAKQSEDEYRRDVLDSLIAQALRYRDVERFGAQEISKDAIEARLHDIAARFPSPADFEAAAARTELTLDEIRGLVNRQLQVEAYIQERFSPLVFVSTDEIEAYYRGAWSAQRRERGLSIPPLIEVVDEIRQLLKASRLQTEIQKWTDQLRSRANVDIYAWR